MWQGQTIEYTVKPIYRGDNPIPVAVSIDAVGSGGFQLHVVIPNE